MGHSLKLCFVSVYNYHYVATILAAIFLLVLALDQIAAHFRRGLL